MLVSREAVQLKESLRFADCALWQHSRLGDLRASLTHYWQSQFVGVTLQAPHVVPELAISSSRLGTMINGDEIGELSVVAHRLGTTVAMLLHLSLAIIAARLGATGAESTASSIVACACQVAANREHCAGKMHHVVGCMNTSVPVLVNVATGDTLATLTTRLRQAFADAHAHAALMPRGEFMRCAGLHMSELFEKIPHVNVITIDAGRDTITRTHRLSRPQRERSALLLRIRIGANELMNLHSDDMQVKRTAAFILCNLLRRILSAKDAGSFDALHEVDDIMRRTRLIVQQMERGQAAVDRAISTVTTATRGSDSFIWLRLLERQKRWFEHTSDGQLARDEWSRFVPTREFPFGFAQLDKLAERRFYVELSCPLPRLLLVIEEPSELIRMAAQLPLSWVVKPVGAGHSDGVIVVRDGLVVSRGRTMPLDVERVAAELLTLRQKGGAWHSDRFYAWNTSRFLVEELVVDEFGGCPPRDYKVTVLGARVLWVLVLFKDENAVRWAAFVDANFELLPPALDPGTLFSLHGTLVCTEPSQLPRAPSSWAELIQQAQRLGARLRLFARLDWYADALHGPLLGELTLFPHILQPRTMYSTWANAFVQQLWRRPDGCAPSQAVEPAKPDACVPSACNSLLDLLSTSSSAVWCVSVDGQDRVTYAELHGWIAAFDLQAWGVAHGRCVALLMPNGPHLGACLLATMNRYCCVPLDPRSPADALATTMRRMDAALVLTLHASKEADKAVTAAAKLGLTVVRLVTVAGRIGAPSLPQLPEQLDSSTRRAPTDPCSLDEPVLLISTSGTTGESRLVSFTLRRLIMSGRAIATMLNLRSDDTGLNMLPLHHIGGIACQLVAPLTVQSSMCFLPALDPVCFINAATCGVVSWCYAVPAMWSVVVKHCAENPPTTGANHRWDRLRLVRSAGAALSHALAQQLFALFGGAVTILPTYGMTEAMPIASPPADYALDKPGSVGRPVAGLEVAILDPLGASELDAGCPGEVAVRGCHVFDGYVDGVEEQRFMHDGFWRTGDLGFVDSEGWLFVTGRVKEAINSGGDTMAPVEIEAALSEHPDVSELMVFAVPHVELYEAPAVAVALPSCGTLIGLTTLRSWASSRLPHAQLPLVLVHVQELPKTALGKLRRVGFAQQLRLPALCTQEMRTYTTSVPDGEPRLLEQWLASPPANAAKSDARGVSQLSPAFVLSKVQDCVHLSAQVNVDTHLMDAGLNSLVVLKLATLLSRSLDRRIEPDLIFEYPTARNICHGIQRSETAQALEPVVTQKVLDASGEATVEPLPTPLVTLSTAAFVPRESTGVLLQTTQLDNSVGVTLGAKLPAVSFQVPMLIRQHLFPLSAAYNMLLSIPLAQPCTICVARAALHALARRHATLRTHFAFLDGCYYQVIAPADGAHVPLTFHKAPCEAWRGIIREEARTPFSLCDGTPPLRAVLLHDVSPELSPTDASCLVLTVHHVVSDRTSLRIIFGEIRAFCAELAAGRPPPQLQAAGMIYAQYALWQQSSAASNAAESHWHWWKDKLKGVTQFLTFPYDCRQPHTQDAPTGHVISRLESGALQPLSSLCRSLGVTPLCVFLTVWAALLCHHSGQDELVIGVPHELRHSAAEFNGVVGLFVNTIPLRLNGFLERTLRDAISVTFQELLDCLRHAALLPIHRIVDASGVQRSGSRSPLFQTLVDFDSHERSSPLSLAAQGSDELKAQRINFPNSKVDFELRVQDSGGSVNVILIYDSILVERETAHTLLSQYLQLLSDALASSNTTLGSLVDTFSLCKDDLCCSKASQMEARGAFQTVPPAWTHPVSPFPDSCVHTLFEAQATRTSHAVAVEVLGGEQVSYAQLLEMAGRIAELLAARGAQLGNFVPLLAPRSPNLVAAMFGCMQVGAAFVPIDPTYPTQRKLQMLEDVAASIIIVGMDGDAPPDYTGM